MSLPTMDVLIATHGRPDSLYQTLASLLRSVQSGNVKQIVVVENGGVNGAQSIIDDLDHPELLQYLYHDEANKSSALNYGLAHCNDGLIFMTDDDVEISPSALAAYQAIAAQFGPGHFFGGPTVAKYEQEPPHWLVPFLPPSARGLKAGTGFLDAGLCFLGFNWAAFRNDLLSAGGFDSDFGPGSHTGATGQESDMQRRLVAAGIRGVWVPDARVSHVVPKERCTPEWVVRRAYRSGVEHGLQMARRGMFKAQRYAATKRSRAMLRSIASAFTTDPSRRLRTSMSREWIKGFYHGMRVANTAPPISTQHLLGT